MDKGKFVDDYLNRLLEDKDVRKYFDDSKTDRERELLEKSLKSSLENSYDTYAKEYFDKKGIGSYLSSFLRYTGGAADAIGTYMFWALGGAGFGVKGVGMLEKTAADAIDARHYAKYAKAESLTDKVKGGGKIAGEGLAERALAYLPLGIGEATDLVRGKKKFDNKVLSYAVKYAKNNFTDYVKGLDKKEPYVIPLKRFQNPEYSDTEELAEAA